MPIVDSSGTDRTAYTPYLAPKGKPESAEDILFNTIKNILTITGGGIGASSGLADFGTTSIPGALAGAGLGRGIGEGIHNIYKQQSGQPMDTYAPFKAIPEGALMEAGGQVGGNLLGKVAESLLPANSQSLKDVLATNRGGVRQEFHGSSVPIESPQKGFVQTGNKGNQVFFTTPNAEVASSMGLRRAFLDNGPEAFNKGIFPEPVMNKYGMSKVNEMELHTPVSMAKANELGNILGLSKQDINDSIKNSIVKGDIDADTLWIQYLARNNSAGETGSVHDIGNDMIQKLKDAGYRRLSVNMDPMSSPKETIHFEPEQDLYSQSQMKALQDRLSAPTKQPMPEYMKQIADILSKSAITNKR